MPIPRLCGGMLLIELGHRAESRHGWRFRTRPASSGRWSCQSPDGPEHGQKLALGHGQVQVFDDERFAVIALLDPVENDIMVRPVGGCILRQNRSPCRASPSLMRRGCPFVKTVSRGCRESTRKYPLFFSQMPGAQPVCPKIVQRAKAHNRRATAAVDPAWCPAVKRSWCGWRDLNPHAFWAPEPKSGASANSATPALSGSGSA
jgi:hypothetical protein